MVKAIFCFIFVVLFGFNASAEEDIDSLLGLSFKELKNVKVTSVSKKKENAFEAPAAIYVITADDIRRSGATSIPEALRMVPGIEVAQLDSNTWAITSRGFQRQFVNKLLVLMDGRSIYTPLFSGTYWDVQDTVLEDIARIEVIRGPGATLWGANAVNGVINIITKSAKNTQGTYVSAHLGDYERGTAEARYGGKVGNDLHYRFYGKQMSKGETKTATGQEVADNWYTSRGGFKINWDKSAFDSYTVQGDVYREREQQLYSLPLITSPQHSVEEARGGNIITKWDHKIKEGSDINLQFYLDYIERNILVLNQERITADFDFQHNLRYNDRNEIVWGLGYRYFRDELDGPTVRNNVYIQYTPKNSSNNLYSGFIQDKIELYEDKLFLTVGSKFEDNYYTSFEFQPNARIQWSPTKNQSVWGAVSRAVRTPSRGEDGIALVAGAAGSSLVRQVGNKGIEAEKLIAYELGYRIQPSWRASFDLAVFYDDYDNIRTFEPYSGLNIPLANHANAETYGFEIGSRLSVTKNWNLYANYSFVTVDIHTNDRPGVGANDSVAEVDEGKSPKNKFSLLSRVNLPHNVELDANVYYVDNLSSISIPTYIRFDARLGWRPIKSMEVSLVGQNLFDDYHPEFSKPLYSVSQSEIGRSVYGKVSFRF